MLERGESFMRVGHLSEKVGGGALRHRALCSSSTLNVRTRSTAALAGAMKGEQAADGTGPPETDPHDDGKLDAHAVRKTSSRLNAFNSSLSASQVEEPPHEAARTR